MNGKRFVECQIQQQHVDQGLASHASRGVVLGEPLDQLPDLILAAAAPVG
jgi:hypothetical protein